MNTIDGGNCAFTKSNERIATTLHAFKRYNPASIRKITQGAAKRFTFKIGHYKASSGPKRDWIQCSCLNKNLGASYSTLMHPENTSPV